MPHRTRAMRHPYRSSPLPATGKQPTTTLKLTPAEVSALDSFSPTGSRADKLRALIRAEHSRRSRKAPHAIPKPRRIPDPDKPRYYGFRLTQSELDQLDAIRQHAADTEGIHLDRGATVRRLIHEERRRRT